MKNFLRKTLILSLAAVTCLLLPSCKKEETKNHVCGEWTVIKEPTCNERGVRSRNCVICGEQETEEIGIVDHKYDDIRHCIWCGKYESTENLKFTLADDKASYVVSGYNGSKSDVVIPCEYNSLPVSAIADNAFSKNNKIVTVYIHSSMTKIGKEAFSQCSSLVSISLPNSVSEIGENAFADCEKLVEVINHTKLSISAGSDDHGGIAKNAKFVHGNTQSNIKRTDDGYLYYDDGGLVIIGYSGENKNLVLPESINDKKYSVANMAFAYLPITSVEIGKGAASVGARAFTYCSSLEKVNISSANTEFGESVFENCIFLKEVKLNDSIKKLGASMFRNCTSLTEVSLPKSLEVFDKNIFYSCTALKSVFFNSAVNEISEYAFFGCTALKYVALSDGATKIGAYTFSGCSSLEVVVVPSSVTEISDFAFFACSSLERINLPSELSKIGNYAFKDCTSLASIVYANTMLKWNVIPKGTEWNTNTGSFTVSCTDGKL